MDTEHPVTTAEPSATFGRSSAAGIAVASVIGGAAGYVVLVLAARVLTKAHNAEFLVFWSLLFGLYGVLIGIQTETVRAASSAREASAVEGVRILPVALCIGLVGAVLAVATSWIWGDRLLGGQWHTQVLWLGAGVLAFSGHVAMTGILGARGAWSTYSKLVAGEASMRLTLVILVCLLGTSIVGLSAATAAASLTWIAFVILSPAARAGMSARSDVGARDFLRRIGHSSAAAFASAVLIVGFPVLLRLTASKPEYATAAPLLLAVTMTQGPLLLPLGAFQGAAIAHVVANRAHGIRALLPIMKWIVLLGAVGTAAAAVLGPPVLRLMRSDYHVSAGVFAALVGGATVIAMLTLTGATCLALARHRTYSAGWVLATGVTVAILCLPLDLNVRSCLALAIGPIFGIAVHSTAVRV